ncbi:MAG: YciI family protein [Actinomycetes bacterium]
MKYVLLFGFDPNSAAATLPAEDQAAVTGEVMQWWEKHSQAGAIIGGAKLQPTSTATTVRGGDKPLVTDGPFVEAKEVLGGFGIVEVANLDEAIALAKTWPLLSAGQSVEIRPVDEM